MAVLRAVALEGVLAREYQAYSDKMMAVVDTLSLREIHRRVLIWAFAALVVAGLGFAYTSLL
jgi:predicted membrane protein